MTDPDLASLVGLRTVKAGHYAQYRGAEERRRRVMLALEGISKTLVQTTAGPEALVVSVVETVRDHVNARWVLFALTDGHLADTAPRHLIAGPRGQILAFEGVRVADPPTGLPDEVLNRLNDVLRGEVSVLHAPIVDDHHVHVPLELDGSVVGGLSAWTGDGAPIDSADLTVLRILASQATVALMNSALFLQARRRAEELAQRNDELVRTQRELWAAQRTGVLTAERARIARELHDSVGQSVLSSGLQMELLRADVSGAAVDRLDKAVRLSRDAMTQLRGAIYALAGAEVTSASLVETLEELSRLHLSGDVDTAVTVRGRPRELPGEVQHAVLRIAGEALFNIGRHADASRAVIGLTYTPDAVRLSVDDDGRGDPAHLRRILDVAACGADRSGRTRGLANIASRAHDCGGTLTIRRSRLGGIRIGAVLPCPKEER